MAREIVEKHISALEVSTTSFDRLGDVAADDVERAAMHLVARSIRSAAAYAIAAGARPLASLRDGTPSRAGVTGTPC